MNLFGEMVEAFFITYVIHITHTQYMKLSSFGKLYLILPGYESVENTRCMYNQWQHYEKPLVLHNQKSLLI